MKLSECFRALRTCLFGIVALGVLSSYSILPQDKKYVDYFLRLHAAELFRTQSFILNKSWSYTSQTKLEKIELRFSCYKVLSIDQARKLIVKITTELLEKINSDTGLREKHIVTSPFGVNRLKIEIKTDNIMSQNCDVASVRTILLNNNEIVYETYPPSTLFSGYSRTYKETFEYALMLLDDPALLELSDSQVRSQMNQKTWKGQVYLPEHPEFSAPSSQETKVTVEAETFSQKLSLSPVKKLSVDTTSFTPKRVSKIEFPEGPQKSLFRNNLFSSQMLFQDACALQGSVFVPSFVHHKLTPFSCIAFTMQSKSLPAKDTYLDSPSWDLLQQAPLRNRSSTVLSFKAKTYQAPRIIATDPLYWNEQTFTLYGQEAFAHYVELDSCSFSLPSSRHAQEPVLYSSSIAAEQVPLPHKTFLCVDHKAFFPTHTPRLSAPCSIQTNASCFFCKPSLPQQTIPQTDCMAMQPQTISQIGRNDFSEIPSEGFFNKSSKTSTNMSTCIALGTVKPIDPITHNTLPENVPESFFKKSQKTSTKVNSCLALGISDSNTVHAHRAFFTDTPTMYETPIDREDVYIAQLPEKQSSEPELSLQEMIKKNIQVFKKSVRIFVAKSASGVLLPTETNSCPPSTTSLDHVPLLAEAEKDS